MTSRWTLRDRRRVAVPAAATPGNAKRFARNDEKPADDPAIRRWRARREKRNREKSERQPAAIPEEPPAHPRGESGLEVADLLDGSLEIRHQSQGRKIVRQCSGTGVGRPSGPRVTYTIVGFADQLVALIRARSASR